MTGRKPPRPPMTTPFPRPHPFLPRVDRLGHWAAGPPVSLAGIPSLRPRPRPEPKGFTTVRLVPMPPLWRWWLLRRGAERMHG